MVALPQARPCFADQDAVAWVARVVTERDGLVQTVATDLVGEHGDILRAVVGEAGDAVAIDEDLRGGIERFFVREGAGVLDEAIRNAAVKREVLAAPALQLFRGGSARDYESPKGDGRDNDSNSTPGGDAGVLSYGVPGAVQSRLAKGFPDSGVEKVRGVAYAWNHGMELRIAQQTRVKTLREAMLVRESTRCAITAPAASTAFAVVFALECVVRVNMRNKRAMNPAAWHPLDLANGRRVRSTTVICVRRGDAVVMAADGQVTLGATVMKHSAKKIRRLYNDKILAGFAGSTADAFSLFTRFESKLEQYGGNLGRSAVELAKDWRTDKLLRQLQALLIVADSKQMFLLSGDGDVIEPDTVGEGAHAGTIATIGSGGSFALAAATALMESTPLSAREIVEKSMKIAAEICIYSNESVTVEELKAE